MRHLITLTLLLLTGVSYALTLTGTNNGYIWGVLDVNKQVYSDRAYFYTSVPPEYVGEQYLITRNDDKNSTTAFMFMTDEPVKVVIGYDIRVKPIPTWLESYTKLPGLATSSSDTFELYEKEYASGDVILGGNSALTNGSSMYFVIAVPVESVPRGLVDIPGAPGITASPGSVIVPETEITISWQHDGVDIDSFIVFIRDNMPSAEFNEIGTTTDKVMISFTRRGDYCFSAKAVRGELVSDFATEVCTII